jgi:hypothetical protein
MHTAESVAKAILADLDNRGLLNGIDDVVLAEIGDEIEGNVANLGDENKALRGTLTYIQTQAKDRPSGDALTLSVIERNAAAALHPNAAIFRRMVAKATSSN